MYVPPLSLFSIIEDLSKASGPIDKALWSLGVFRKISVEDVNNVPVCPGDDQFSAAGEKLRMKYIWKSLLDWKTWVGSELVCCIDQRS